MTCAGCPSSLLECWRQGQRREAPKAAPLLLSLPPLVLVHERSSLPARAGPHKNKVCTYRSSVHVVVGLDMAVAGSLGWMEGHHHDVSQGAGIASSYKEPVHMHDRSAAIINRTRRGLCTIVDGGRAISSKLKFPTRLRPKFHGASFMVQSCGLGIETRRSRLLLLLGACQAGSRQLVSACRPRDNVAVACCRCGSATCRRLRSCSTRCVVGIRTVSVHRVAAVAHCRLMSIVPSTLRARV